MSGRVIDVLEPIKVDEHHGAGGVAFGQRSRQTVEQQLPVRQPRKHVVRRLVLQARLIVGDQRLQALSLAVELRCHPHERAVRTGAYDTQPFGQDCLVATEPGDLLSHDVEHDVPPEEEQPHQLLQCNGVSNRRFADRGEGSGPFLGRSRAGYEDPRDGFGRQCRGSQHIAADLVVCHGTGPLAPASQNFVGDLARARLQRLAQRRACRLRRHRDRRLHQTIRQGITRHARRYRHLTATT